MSHAASLTAGAMSQAQRLGRQFGMIATWLILIGLSIYGINLALTAA